MTLLTKWPLELVVVRHGQSEHNAILDLEQESLEKELERMKITRDADIHLTDLGWRQAEQTGLYLAKRKPFDICLSSPYTRTDETAQGIISGLGYDLDIHFDDRLREKEFGIFHALTIEEMKENYPDWIATRHREGKYYFRLPGGENYPDVGMRVHEILDKLVRDHAGQRVLVVTHAVVYNMFRQQYEHAREKEVLSWDKVPNCGVQTYQLQRNRKHPRGIMKLVEWNAVGYAYEEAGQRNS